MTSTILSRIAAGDPTAVQQCLDTYGGLVWTIALRFASDPDDAEDAVQEIFVDLWRSAARFDPARSSEKTFIAMIARRRLIDRLRKQTRRPATVGIEAGEAVADSRDIERGFEADVAARVLEELRPEQRKTIQLAVLDGLSHREVADTLGLPLGTVKSHIRRGLAIIRERLDDPLPEGSGGSAS